MSLFDVPLFDGTEAAIGYGKELRRITGSDEFQTLVRTWMVTELAAREAKHPQSKVNLATRSGHLREAVTEFLFPEGMAIQVPDENLALQEIGGS